MPAGWAPPREHKQKAPKPKKYPKWRKRQAYSVLEVTLAHFVELDITSYSGDTEVQSPWVRISVHRRNALDGVSLATLLAVAMLRELHVEVQITHDPGAPE